MFGDSNINQFNFSIDKLGDVCDVRDGTHDSPKYQSSGYPLLTSRNITNGSIDLSDCNHISEEDFMKINKRSYVDYGDILMPMIGTVGNPVIVNINEVFAIKNVSLIKFRSDSKVLNVYIKYLLKSDYFDKSVIEKVRGGTQKFISLSDIRNLVILVPPINIQQSFASFVKQIDKLASNEKKSLYVSGLGSFYMSQLTFQ